MSSREEGSRLEGLVAQLKQAEQAVASAQTDFLRMRHAVDSAGELALWQQLHAAERSLQEAIRHLDEIVYPAEEAPRDT